MAADIAFIIALLLTVAIVARGGAMRAGVNLFVVTFAGLLAMNWFELLATGLSDRLGSDSGFAKYLDFTALLFLFAAGVFVLRFAVKGVLPESGELTKGIELPARWALAILTGYVAASFLAAAAHTYPGSRDFGGYYPPEPDKRDGYVMKTLAPDYRWLGFTQHTSVRVFSYGEDKHVFDGPRFTAGEHTGRWPTFPLRYARWRASLNTD